MSPTAGDMGHPVFCGGTKEGRGGLVVSHPCARKKAQRWGTEICRSARKDGGGVRGMPCLQQRETWGTQCFVGERKKVGVGSWYPTLAPEKRRKDGARRFVVVRGKTGVGFEVCHVSNSGRHGAPSVLWGNERR